MTDHPLRLAGAALAVLASQALPVLAQERPSMALVLIGPKNDNSWADAAHRALEAEAARGSRTAFAESVTDADVARVMRDYVDQGFDTIVAHSFSYQDAVFEVAAEAPKTNFAWAGGINQTAANVSDYDQPFYEPAYLVGILAGHVSPSGHLGALYGFDIPVCHAMGEAMLAGAKTVNPAATLTVTAVGDWGDVAAAKEAGSWPRSTPRGSTTGSAAARGLRSARSRRPKRRKAMPPAMSATCPDWAPRPCSQALSGT
jgi:basic membrane lipoprotein Med (substrate-binding protein (PBP1-ABC) superfamily)